MAFDHLTESCFSDVPSMRGLDPARFKELLDDLDPALAELRAARENSSLPLLNLPDAPDLPALEEVAADWRSRFDAVVVLGTGGSSLGGQTLCALAQTDYSVRPGCPRVIFQENIDPDGFDHNFGALDLSKTGMLTISKSGGTAETLAQFFLAVDLYKKSGIDPLGDHFLTITEPAANPLRAVCDRLSIPMLEHDPNIGGRYSALSLVGLLPAMMSGLDGAALRRGAAGVMAPLLDGVPAAEFDPAIGAAIAAALAERAYSQSVIMPYIDRLVDFSRWYRQLWAESLGKDGRGTTPVDALGAVDQHSQLQLFLDGPADKMFTIITRDNAGRGGHVDPTLADDPSLDWLAGHSMGDLLNAEQEGLIQTLIDAGRPIRLFRLSALDEETLGGLMMHFMLETILTARLFGVDPFDQPAVERGKILTRQYLAEEGG